MNPTIHRFLLKTFLFSAFAVEKNVISLQLGLISLVVLNFAFFDILLSENLRNFRINTLTGDECSRKGGFVWVYGCSQDLGKQG